jgi:hypothetical protein
MFVGVAFEVFLTGDVATASLVVRREGLKGKIDHLINAKNLSRLFFYSAFSAISDRLHQHDYAM